MTEMTRTKRGGGMKNLTQGVLSFWNFNALDEVGE
jgi:hypothetical protein